jgi:hypothetical protein
MVSRHVDAVVSEVQAAFRRHAVSALQASFGTASQGTPTKSARTGSPAKVARTPAQPTRRKPPSDGPWMLCIAPDCRERHGGPRRRFLCKKHQGTPEATRKAWWKNRDKKWKPAQAAAAGKRVAAKKPQAKARATQASAEPAAKSA